MKRRLFAGLLAACASVLSSTAAANPAEALMTRVRRRYRGETWVITGTVTLLGKDQGRALRRIRTVNRMHGADRQSKIVLQEPARLAGTAFLAFDWSGQREDEAWVYLPELGRATRLATGNRSDYFLGSDFTYGDLQELKLEHFDFELVADERPPPGQVLVQATPREPIRDMVVERTGYQRIWYWVDTERHVVLKAKFWLKDPGWLKFYTAQDLQQIEGAWFARREQMVLTQHGRVVHTTLMDTERVEVNVRLEDSQFSPQALGRGAP
jgi:outer membrane lipoprotein-sorting protein